MSDTAYESYRQKCKELGIKASPKKKLLSEDIEREQKEKRIDVTTLIKEKKKPAPVLSETAKQDIKVVKKVKPKKPAQVQTDKVERTRPEGKAKFVKPKLTDEEKREKRLAYQRAYQIKNRPAPKPKKAKLTDEEKELRHKTYMKVYREKNRDKLNAQTQAWRDAKSPEQLKLERKEYREKNGDHLRAVDRDRKEQRKGFYQSNPEALAKRRSRDRERYHKQKKNLVTVLKPNNQCYKSEFRILTCNQLSEYLLNFNPYHSFQTLYDSIPIIIVNKTVLTFLMPKKYLDFKENILLPLLNLSSRFVTGIEINGTCHSIFNFQDINNLNNLIKKNNIESPSTILSIPPLASIENLPLIKKANPLNGKNKNSTLTTECGSQFGNTSHPDYNSEEAFPSTYDRPYLVLKRSFDILFSAVALILLSPLFLIIYFLIKIDSRGPGFYIHERIGHKAKKLKLIKFRTMITGSEKLFKNDDEKREFYRQFKIQNDIRITRLGKYLRKYSIDELPQFLNVLLGSMTIVGPRPIILEEAKWYGIHLPLLLSVKPGVTSFWSIKGRNQIPYPHRANIELDYVNKMSFLTDLNVIFKTITSIFINPGV